MQEIVSLRTDYLYDASNAICLISTATQNIPLKSLGSKFPSVSDTVNSKSLIVLRCLVSHLL